MRLTKSQGIVITLLNLVIIALVAIILFVPNMSLGESAEPNAPAAVDPEQPEEQEPVHNKLRAPTAGKTENIISETRLMGLGDESVVDVFFFDGYIFVFGNATVKGLDFDNYGGFVCKLSEDGNITAYSYFGGKLHAVCAYGERFIAAAGDKLYAVDKECIATVCVEQTDGEAVDVFGVDNVRVAVVTQPSSTSLKLTEYAVSRDNWNTGHSTRIDSGYTLRYFDCFLAKDDSYVMAVRAHSLPRYDSLVIYTFNAGGDPKDYNYGGTGENLTRPYDVVPCRDGYIAVTSKNGIATVININYSFTVYRAQSLGFTASDARLLFYDGSYYACFSRTDGAVTYKVDSIAERDSVSEFDGINLYAVDEGYFMGVVGGLGAAGEKSVAVDLVRADKSVLSLEVTGGEVYALKRSEGKIIAVISAVGGDDLSVPSGGRDIYVITVKCE